MYIDLAWAKSEALIEIVIIYSHKKENCVILNSNGSSKGKKSRRLVSKKDIFATVAHFFVTWNLPVTRFMEKMSNVITQKFATCVPVVFSHCRSFLPCYGRSHFSLSHRRYNFHVVLPTKIRPLCFSSLALTLFRFASLSPTFSFLRLSLFLHSKLRTRQLI